MGYEEQVKERNREQNADSTVENLNTKLSLTLTNTNKKILKKYILEGTHSTKDIINVAKQLSSQQKTHNYSNLDLSGLTKQQIQSITILQNKNQYSVDYLNSLATGYRKKNKEAEEGIYGNTTVIEPFGESDEETDFNKLLDDKLSELGLLNTDQPEIPEQPTINETDTNAMSNPYMDMMMAMLLNKDSTTQDMQEGMIDIINTFTEQMGIIQGQSNEALLGMMDTLNQDIPIEEAPMPDMPIETTIRMSPIELLAFNARSPRLWSLRKVAIDQIIKIYEASYDIMYQKLQLMQNYNNRRVKQNGRNFYRPQRN